jgi:hypothetical protein
MRRTVIVLVNIIVACIALAGCKEKEEPPRREPEGRRIKVRAPYTHVDIFVPDDDEEDTEVDVDVDD